MTPIVAFEAMGVVGCGVDEVQAERRRQPQINADAHGSRQKRERWPRRSGDRSFSAWF
jgi:hypothetical protein